VKVRQLIDKITQHNLFDKFCEINTCSEEYFYKNKMNSYVDEGWHGKNMRYEYIRRKLLKGIPSLTTYVKFKFGLWRTVEAGIYIGIEDNRRENKVSTKIWFRFVDLRETPKTMYYNYNSKELPPNLSLDAKSLERHARKVLSEYLYEDGVVGYYQFRFNETKKEAVQTYKIFSNKERDLLKNSVGYDEDKSLKHIFKQYNIKSYVSLKDTVKVVNKIGKQKVTKIIERFDFNHFSDIDGDIDELENAFWESMKDNTIYLD
jgi:hypothetical protein